MTKPNRRMWSKLAVPQEVADLFHMIARKNGYTQSEGWRFLYTLLEHQYPDDVDTLKEYVGIPALLDSLTPTSSSGETPGETPPSE